MDVHRDVQSVVRRWKRCSHAAHVCRGWDVGGNLLSRGAYRLLQNCLDDTNFFPGSCETQRRARSKVIEVMIPICFIIFWRSAALKLQLFVTHISTNTIHRLSNSNSSTAIDPSPRQPLRSLCSSCRRLSLVKDNKSGIRFVKMFSNLRILLLIYVS